MLHGYFFGQLRKSIASPVRTPHAAISFCVHLDICVVFSTWILMPRVLFLTLLWTDWLVCGFQHFGGDDVPGGGEGPRPLPGLLPPGREVLCSRGV